MRAGARWEYSLDAIVAGRAPGASRARRALAELGAELCEQPAPDGFSRQWLIRAPDEQALGASTRALRDHLGNALQQCADRVVRAHSEGVLRTRAARSMATLDDYALVADPGARRVARLICADPARASTLTTSGNTIAVVSDGSDESGLGPIGPAAELPMLEGKAVAYASVARLNAVPLVVRARDLSSLIDTIVAVSPNFAGIHVTDIAAPRCFHVTHQLASRLSLPVLDEHVQAFPIVVLAALHNALSIVCKPLGKVRIVVGGLTPAAVGTALLLRHAGASNLNVVEDDHVITRDDLNGASYTRSLIARQIETDGLKGTLQDALRGADVYLRFAPDAIEEVFLTSMAPDPIAFSLTDSALDDGAHILPRAATITAGIATTETNMLTSALVFPGLMRGMIDHRTGPIDLTAAAAVAHALARSVQGGPDTDRVLPTLADPRVPSLIAAAVCRHAPAHDGRKNPADRENVDREERAKRSSRQSEEHS